MQNLIKMIGALPFCLILIVLVRITKSQDGNTTSTMLEYYKMLAKSRLLVKAQKARFIASIKRMDTETTYAEHHVCTGAIISDESVLTTAECTYERNRPLHPHEITVVVGIQYGSMNDQFAQVMPVRRIRRHYKYNPGSDEHNIAIILLNNTIEYIGDTVQKALIATKRPANFEKCVGVGFGVLNYKDTKLSQILEGELKVWPELLCQTYLKKHGMDQDLGFCAGDLREINSKPCKIIASEPLYCDDRLYGVSVFSIGCESYHGFASVYVGVWDNLDFISQHAETLRDRASIRNKSQFWLLTILARVLMSF